jgi:hypothetical protein
MQTATPFRWLAALVLWLGPLLAAHATHILGGEITYKSVASTTAGVPRYHVTAILYRDPSQAQQPTAQIVFSRGGCGSAAATGSFALTVVRSQVTSTYSLGCSPTVFSYEVIPFETDVDLPAGQWTITVTEYNRAASIQNLVNSVATSFYVSTYLDNTLAGQNASPKFLSTLLPYLCNGLAQRYSFSAFDSDGDSLVYQFRQPEQSTQSTLPPASPYDCGTAIAGTLSPHFQLNAATGALTALPLPVQQGRFAMAARVSEYRRINSSWQLIGYVTRDITYLAVGSLNQTPRFTALRLNGASTTQPLGQTIRVQPGQAVVLALEAADPDAGQTLRFESQAPGIIPGLSLQTTGATSAALTWQVPATLPPGRYTATVAVLDNGCPNASEEYTFSFLVAAQPLAARPGRSPEMAAYPTPFREQVQFQTLAGGEAVVMVDALGREVARLTSAADGLVRWQPAATLPAGLYLARSASSGQPLARLLRAE